MKDFISIVEIPVKDFARAVKFYQAVLGIDIEAAEMGEDKLGLFPSDGQGVFVQLVHGKDHKPSAEGTTVYLHTDDVQKVADKVAANGGEVVVPKSEIPEMGFFAIFIDTEGNKVGLYSA